MAESHYSVDSARHFHPPLLNYLVDFERIILSHDEPSALAAGFRFSLTPSRH